MKEEKDRNESEGRIGEYDLKIAYKNGIAEGLKRCSWWEDGIQYVGTSKKTLESAIQEIEKEYNHLKP